jgi:hypothetical protein
VEGNISFKKCVFYDDFLGDLLADEWAPTNANGGTEAITAASGGTLTLTTATTDHDRSIIGTALNWYPAQNCIMEARVKVDSIADVGIFVGFSDAVTEANDTVPFNINGTTVEDTATNGVGFCYSTDATTDKWYIVNTNAGTQGGTIMANAPVAATYETFRVAVDAAGNATYYRNDALVGYKALAVATTSTFSPVLSCITHTTAAKVLSVDYVKCWQDRA